MSLGLDIGDVFSAFGLTGQIASSVTAALADPTSSNVNAVVKAYADNGQVVPAKLYAYLIKINEERHPEDTVRGSAFPWLFAGGATLAFLIFRKRR